MAGVFTLNDGAPRPQSRRHFVRSDTVRVVGEGKNKKNAVGARRQDGVATGRKGVDCRRGGGRLFFFHLGTLSALTFLLSSFTFIARFSFPPYPPTTATTAAPPPPPPPPPNRMNLRDGSVVGGSKGSLPSSSSRISQGDFARGAARVLGRWTALRLAVEGGWGGPESGAKAGLLLDDVVSWFASDSGELFPPILEGGGGGGGGGEGGGRRGGRAGGLSRR